MYIYIYASVDVTTYLSIYLSLSLSIYIYIYNSLIFVAYEKKQIDSITNPTQIKKNNTPNS